MESPKTIQLPAPQKQGGLTVLEAFSKRRSYRGGIGSADITHHELSNVLWAAAGFNRPQMRTAPSALNSQAVDIYAIMPQGAYRYNPGRHELELVSSGDHRRETGGGQDFVAEVPVILVLAADHSKYHDASEKMGFDISAMVPSMAAMDTGIVAQNINLVCAGCGLATITRGMMDHKALRETLRLKDSQHPLLNNAVGYPEE